MTGPYLSRKENYALFLESDFWKEIRVECFRRDGWMCRFCGTGSSGKLQAHHVHYPEDWYKTTLDHLITLCRKCHEKEHGIKAEQKPKKQERVSGIAWWPGMYEGKPCPQKQKPQKQRRQFGAQIPKEFTRRKRELRKMRQVCKITRAEFLSEMKSVKRQIKKWLDLNSNKQRKVTTSP